MANYGTSRFSLLNLKQAAKQTQATINAGICPKCGGQLIKRNGKYGSFYGCSNYPNCKFTTK
ncbi:MAG: topoisomerase DNA-binding C4 zinc finger domain-containing protein [Prevotella sp.]|nr:topoisomerase DNA-binding C4 zinc finger domain-containing protein [Prevotella sp.]